MRTEVESDGDRERGWNIKGTRTKNNSVSQTKYLIFTGINKQ